MRRALLGVLLGATLVGSTSGCVNRFLVEPTSTEPHPLGYLYFVEQTGDQNSRLRRCEIHADNSVACETVFNQGKN